MGQGSGTRRRPQRLDDVESTALGRPHRGETSGTRRALGKIQPEDSVAIAAPVPVKQGRKNVPRAGVGLRVAPAAKALPSAKLAKTWSDIRTRVRVQREERRRRVWDKLDAAREFARKRWRRLTTFSPHREPEPFDEDDDGIF